MTLINFLERFKPETRCYIYTTKNILLTSDSIEHLIKDEMLKDVLEETNFNAEVDYDYAIKRLDDFEYNDDDDDDDDVIYGCLDIFINDKDYNYNFNKEIFDVLVKIERKEGKNE